MTAITRRSQLYAQGLGAGEAAGLVRSAAGAVGDIALDQVYGVTMRSQLSQPVHMTTRQALGIDPTEAGMGTMFMQISKPEISLETTLGTIKVAPWGEPTLNLYPFFLVASIVGVGALVGLAVRAWQRES
jgi:hypothetical protein